MQTIGLPDIQKQGATLQVAERFFDSIVMFALFDLGVFKLLASGPKTVEQLHKAIGGNEPSLLATLDAAVALRVLTKDADGRYAAPEAYLDCLGREDSPAYNGEWVAFLHALAVPLLRLGEAIRENTTPGALFEDMSEDNLPARRMTQAMDAYARTRGVEIVDKIDFSGTRRLLDVGCGPGTYSIAILERNPQARATGLDLPGPISEARRIAERYGVGDRMEFVAGDANTFKPAELYDTLLLSNTLHMIGPEGSVALLKSCYKFLAPGGRILVQAQYLNDDRISPRWPTLLNLFQRIATPEGRNHAIGETGDWMRTAGFENVEFVRFSLWNVCSCLIGIKPSA